MRRRAEFLKDATVRSRKIFQRLRKILAFERKKAQFSTVLPFLGIFPIFLLVLPILFAQNFRTEILVAQKKLLLESLIISEVFSDLINMFLFVTEFSTYLITIIFATGMAPMM